MPITVDASQLKPNEKYEFLDSVIINGPIPENVKIAILINGDLTINGSMGNTVQLTAPGNIRIEGVVGERTQISGKTIFVGNNVGRFSQLLATEEIKVHGNVGHGTKISAGTNLEIKGVVDSQASLSAPETVHIIGRMNKDSIIAGSKDNNHPAPREIIIDGDAEATIHSRGSITVGNYTGVATALKSFHAKSLGNWSHVTVGVSATEGRLQYEKTASIVIDGDTGGQCTLTNSATEIGTHSMTTVEGNMGTDCNASSKGFILIKGAVGDRFSCDDAAVFKSASLGHGSKVKARMRIETGNAGKDCKLVSDEILVVSGTLAANTRPSEKSTLKGNAITIQTIEGSGAFTEIHAIDLREQPGAIHLTSHKEIPQDLTIYISDQKNITDGEGRTISKQRGINMP